MMARRGGGQAPALHFPLPTPHDSLRWSRPGRGQLTSRSNVRNLARAFANGFQRHWGVNLHTAKQQSSSGRDNCRGGVGVVGGDRSELIGPYCP